MVLGTVSATNAASQQLRLDYITTKPLSSFSAFKDALPEQQRDLDLEFAHFNARVPKICAPKLGDQVQDVLLASALLVLQWTSHFFEVVIVALV